MEKGVIKLHRFSITGYIELLLRRIFRSLNY